MSKIIFITGTDTGAGKTVLTALCLCHLQSLNKSAAALKPFSSGSWNDTDLLRALHRPPILRNEVTRWFFKAPLAPAIAARQENNPVELKEVLVEITRRAPGLEYLLVEGAGGLLAPLGKDFNALNLIQELNADVLIAARNKLGVINHALLTIHCLKTAGIDHWKIALMGGNLDESSVTNAHALHEFLGKNSSRLRQLPEFEQFDAGTAPKLAAVTRLLLASLLP